MNKFIYFMAVGLAFTVLQVATVSAADVSCAKLADGSLPPHCQTDSNAADHESAGTGHAAGDHGGMAPAMTGDDTHTGGGEDCAAMSTPALVAACWDRKSSHADGAHGGMAAGTTAMCGGVPCTTAGATSDGAAPDCAALPTPAEVAACWESNTAGGPAGGAEGCAAEETPALVAACRANQTAAGN